MSLTEEQLHILEIVERCASMLSILGIITIIVTFCFSQRFRNPMHRLIFINAFYNAFDVTGTMISVSGPRAGNGSALCQFQGFLMQMFPLADVFWTFVMAYDVFLIVFRRRDGKDLHKLEVKYISIITPVVFIPALTFLFIHTPEKGPMYGGVTLWCAISPNWVLYRIIFYYVPVWVMISITMLIYCLVGIEIFKRRSAFNSISNDFISLDTVVSVDDTSFHSSNNTTTPAVEMDDQSHPTRAIESRDGKGSVTSVSHLHPSENPTTNPVRPNQSSLSFRQYILMPLMFFVVLLSVWVVPSINRVSSFISPGHEQFGLLLAVGSTGCLRGFWNGVVFITIGMKAGRKQEKLERRTLGRA